MKRLSRKLTEDTPSIDFNPENGVFEIFGRSMPENPAEFYGPIAEWMDHYIKAPQAETKLHIKLDYFNSTSAKHLYNLLIKMEAIKTNSVKVVWYYDENDDLMRLKGMEFQSLLELTFEVRGYE